MNGKEFENVVLMRARQEEEHHRMTMSRYGTQSSFSKGKPFNTSYFEHRLRGAAKSEIPEIVRDLVAAAKESVDGHRPHRSLPDFEGILVPRGAQFIIETKVCGDASFQIDKGSATKSRQLNHMLTRSRFGAVCFYLIHFTERKLVKVHEPAQTWAFPVDPAHPWWQAFDRVEVKRITRADCQEYAVLVPWNTLPGGRTPRPDILSAIYEVAALRKVSALSGAPSIDPAAALAQPGANTHGQTGRGATTRLQRVDGQSQAAQRVSVSRVDAKRPDSRKSPRRAG